MARTFSLALIAACIVLAVAGQLLLKVGIDRIGRVDDVRVLVTRDFLRSAVTTWQVPVAILVYAVGFVLWAAVLSRENLSYAYPFLALTYVAAVFADAFILHTQVPTGRWVGSALVVIGLGFVWRT